MKLNKLQRISRSLDAIENGKSHEFTLAQCCDYISWVAKWNKVPRSEWEPLCEKATKLLQSGFYD